VGSAFRCQGFLDSSNLQGFRGGDYTISVMEKAAEFIEGSLANERSVDQLAVRDTASSSEAELAVRDISSQSVVGSSSS